MALRWTEGFELRQTTGYITRLYAAFSGALGTTTGRLFGKAGTLDDYVTTPSLSSQNTWIIGVGYQAASTVSGAPQIMVLRGATEQCHLETSASGSGYVWVLKRGSTTIATSAIVHEFAAWTYVELKVTARTGTNGVYELRVDEQVEFSGSSVNLAESGSDGADVFRFGATSATHYWDDLYICDDQGSVNNDFLGDSAVRGILPTGDGAATDWTPSTASTHYDKVDDLATAENDADYVATSTNGAQDLYDYANVSGLINGTIRGIMVTTSMKMATTGTSQVKVIVREGSTIYDGDTHTVNGTQVAAHSQIIENSPDDSLPFEVADIDAMQVGVERVA